MPTRVASRDNEVDGAPEFQRKAFFGSKIRKPAGGYGDIRPPHGQTQL